METALHNIASNRILLGR